MVSISLQEARVPHASLGSSLHASSQNNARRVLYGRLVKLMVSAVLLAVLLRAATWSDVLAAAGRLEPMWLVLSLLLFVPQTVVSAWRWQKLVAPFVPLALSDSVRHTLAASAWNLIAPAKMGDFSKAAWLPSLTTTERAKAGSRVMMEKLSDVACLFACIALGLDSESALGVAALLLTGVLVIGLRDRRMQVERRWTPIMLTTLLLWSLHLAQVHLFLLAAGVDATIGSTLLRIPLALFAGLVPGTFCGVGTRDSALVWLYADTAPATTMAVVGLLTSLRYLVPGAAGIVVLARSRRTLSAGEASALSKARDLAGITPKNQIRRATGN